MLVTYNSFSYLFNEFIIRFMGSCRFHINLMVDSLFTIRIYVKDDIENDFYYFPLIFG